MEDRIEVLDISLLFSLDIELEHLIELLRDDRLRIEENLHSDLYCDDYDFYMGEVSGINLSINRLNLMRTLVKMNQQSNVMHIN